MVTKVPCALCLHSIHTQYVWSANVWITPTIAIVYSYLTSCSPCRSPLCSRSSLSSWQEHCCSFPCSSSPSSSRPSSQSLGCRTSVCRSSTCRQSGDEEYNKFSTFDLNVGQVGGWANVGRLYRLSILDLFLLIAQTLDGLAFVPTKIISIFSAYSLFYVSRLIC